MEVCAGLDLMTSSQTWSSDICKTLLISIILRAIAKNITPRCISILIPVSLSFKGAYYSYLLTPVFFSLGKTETKSGSFLACLTAQIAKEKKVIIL